MKNYKRQINLFLYMSLVIVISSFAVLFFNFKKQVKLQQQVQIIEAALTHTDSLGTDLLQIESDKRGFQLTGDPAFLKNFYHIKQSCQEHIAHLKAIHFSTDETKRLTTISSLTNLRIANLDSGIVVYTTKGLAASIAFMQLKGKRELREQLATVVSDFKNKLYTRMAATSKGIHIRSTRNIAGLLTLLIIFVGLMFYAAVRFKRAQQKVISTHTKFREAQRIAKIGSWEWDFATNNLIWSQEEYRLFGQDRATFETTYDNYLQHLSPLDRRIANDLVKEAVAGRAKYAVEHEIVRGDGERIIVFEQGTVLYDEDKKPTGMFGTTQDITSQKKAEQELMVAKKRFQNIFDNAVDGIYQSTLEGKFIMANQAMARIFGYDSPEDLVNSVEHIGRQLYADPAQRKRMSELIVLQGHVEDFELQALTKNQSTIWVSANIRIVRDKNGAIRYFEGTLEDISGRKKAEEQLQSLSNRLQLAVSATGIGIWDWDIVNNQTFWDDEVFRIYNASAADPSQISSIWESSVHPDDLARVKWELQTAIEGGKEYDTEFRVVWNDQSVHHVKGNALVIYDAENKPLRMIGTNTDITARKEAEEEILQLNRNLDQFANITAHDLQEPIRMVSGFLGLLHKKYNNLIDEQGQSYIYRAKDGADRMSVLIKDLLEYSRSGNKAAKKDLVDLAVVMDLVDRDLSITMADTGTVFRMPDNLPIVHGTQSALYRLFLNLVSNGIKFRKKDTTPHITLTVEDKEDWWEFTLQDNGIGVAQKDQTKLFQAFQRLHRRDEYPGTGLGLVTCKKIVETHGGKIWMTSEAGAGTAFHFTIDKALVFEQVA